MDERVGWRVCWSGGYEDVLSGETSVKPNCSAEHTILNDKYFTFFTMQVNDKCFTFFLIQVNDKCFIFFVMQENV